MKKKSAAAMAATAGMSLRNVLWLWWKLLVLVSLTICVLAFLKLQSYSFSDSELSSSALSTSSISRRSRTVDYTGNPKVAFLFLVRRNLPLDFLWGSFFENADTANFSIYVHSEPGFVFDESTTRSTFFYNRQLTNSIKVAWGESSMIQAEKLLLGSALDDPANQRFVLLSDSCVPLYNFSFIYNYLMASPRSFVDSFLDKKDGRYNPKMSPYIPMSKWRKGSQWDKLPRSIIEAFVLLLSPYAPHMAEELWSRLGHSNSLAYVPFPKADAAYLKESTVVLPVQINGKTRGTIQVEETCTEEEAFRLASFDTKLSKFLDGKSIRKRIYVQGKILNIVIDMPKKAKVAQQ